MPTYLRGPQARIQVQLDGVSLDLTSWAKMAGGDKVAAGNNFFPGGMAPAIEIGGQAKRNNLTVERPWTDVLIGVFKQIDNLVGHGTGRVIYSPLDGNGAPIIGGGETYSGVLLEAKRPDVDSETDGVAMLQLVFGVDSQIS